MAADIIFETDCDKNENKTVHLHNQAELLFVLTGNCSVYTGKRSFVLSAEDFAVFNPFETHRQEREEGCHTLSLYIPIELLSDFGIGTINCVSSLQPEKKSTLDLIRTHLANIFQDYSDNSKKLRLNMQAELLGLLSILFQDFSEESEEGQEEKGRKDYVRKEEVLRFVWEHFSEPLTLSQTAESFGLSEGYFSRLFAEITGKNFSSYLREVRLSHAKQLTDKGEASVTELAFSSGFGSVNSFIDAFRKEFGKTPGAYIRSQKEKALENERKKSESHSAVSTDNISYMGLLRYRSIEKSTASLRQAQSEVIEASFGKKTKPLNRIWNKCIGVGYMEQMLWGVLQSALKRAKKELCFQNYHMHGIYADALNVCTRDSDGKLKFNFAYVDLVINFLLNEVKITPWIFLDYTPSCLVTDRVPKMFGKNVVSLPTNLDEWQLLVTETLRHFVSAYGKKEVSSWKFSMEQAVQISVGNCSLEDYKKFYLATYRAIKSVLPEVSICGFGLDTGHVSIKDSRIFDELLSFAKENDDLPDLMSFQSFLCDFTDSDAQNLIYNKSVDEVYSMSDDPDILSKELDHIHEVMGEFGVYAPLFILMFNPGMWGQSPGNDTCFHGACIVKNVIENRDKVDVFAIGNLIDYGEKMMPDNTMYHGSNGLLTYRLVPKAAYACGMLLNELVGDVVSAGNGYILTVSQDRHEFSLLLYYYCPYNLTRHRRTVLSPIEETNYDRYYEFDDKGSKSVHIFLDNLIMGDYILTTKSVNREHGSSYDAWMQMGAPMKTDSILGYLEYRSIYDVSISHARVDESSKLIISALLEPHEVRVIRGKLNEKI